MASPIRVLRETTIEPDLLHGTPPEDRTAREPSPEILTIPARPSARIEAVAEHPAPSRKTTEAENLQASVSVYQSMLGVCLTVSMVLAVRLMLLLAVLIAGALAWKTLENPTLIALSINSAFNLGVVVPIVALYWRRG